MVGREEEKIRRPPLGDRDCKISSAVALHPGMATLHASETLEVKIQPGLSLTQG